MPKPNRDIPALIAEHMVMLRYAIFINEDGRLFLQAMTGSRSQAAQLAKYYVDDAMPRNTVEVWYKRVNWEKHGTAGMGGDGEAYFTLEKKDA